MGENPAAGSTQLALTLAQPGLVRIALYDVLGREVAVLADRMFPAGVSGVTLDASRLPAGTYAARATGTSGTQAVRVTVAR